MEKSDHEIFHLYLLRNKKRTPTPEKMFEQPIREKRVRILRRARKPPLVLFSHRRRTRVGGELTEWRDLRGFVHQREFSRPLTNEQRY